MDASSDVYSMGVVLFELLTGQWPFMEETRVDMLRAHLTQSPPSLTETRPDLHAPAQLNTIIQKAMQKKQTDRFKDATEMRAALESVVAHAAPTAIAAAAAIPTAPLGSIPSGLSNVPHEITGSYRSSGSSTLTWLLLAGAVLFALAIVGAALGYVFLL